MSLPVLDLSGSPLAQGRAHGEALRDRVHRNLEIYLERFQRELAMDRDEVLRRAALYARAVAAAHPDYAEGMHGIAEGSGCRPEEVALLNMRYELIYQAWGRQLMQRHPSEEQEGCTSFAVLPSHTENGHLWLGQNWDWIPEVQGAVIRSTAADGLRVLGFTEAGIFGEKIGLNSEGLGLAINGMLSTADDWLRLRTPFHVRCYRILRSRGFAQAVAVVTGEERSCSANFMIAQAPDSVVDLEAAPEALAMQHPEAGILTHANNFVDPRAIGVREPISPKRHWSCRRRERLRELLQVASPVTMAHLRTCLQDHQDYPNALCRHPDTSLPEQERSVTVTGVVMDLHTGSMGLTEGQPCSSPFQEVALKPA